MRYRHKGLLLALSAVLLAAFAGGGAAQASYWHVNGEKLEAEAELHVNGYTVHWVLPTWGVAPCAVSFEGVVRNGPSKAEGTLTGSTSPSSCGTSSQACQVKSPERAAFPWTLSISGSQVDIEGFWFRGAWEGTNCPNPGGEFIFTGTLKGGEFDNATGCLKYLEDPGLKWTFWNSNVFTDGKLCFTDENGSPLSLE